MATSIEVGFKEDQDPMLWVNGENVTSRCHSLELLPGRCARARLFIKPFVVTAAGSLLREVVEGPYVWRIHEGHS